MGNPSASKSVGEFERLIGRYGGRAAGPVVVCVAGIHGNEPAGIRALKRVLRDLADRRVAFRGELVALAGNVKALAKGRRYLEKDLNRIWTVEQIEAVKAGRRTDAPGPEDLEQQELLAELEAVFQRAVPETVYLMDMHTSSADGQPFVCIGDTLRNRAFAFQFPVPVILGLEEQLDGTLLEYVNNLGHVTLGFEGGQHDLPASADYHEAAVWIALVAAGNLCEEDVPDIETARARLGRRAAGLPRILEVRYRHPVHPEDGFLMEADYRNFQRIRRGELLARDRRGEIRATQRGRILLPLYQGLGDDGFFVTREVRSFRLMLSAILRRLGLDAVIRRLPGVRRHPTLENALIVDPKIARVWAGEIFHLLGYRKHRSQDGALVVTRRVYDRDIPHTTGTPRAFQKS